MTPQTPPLPWLAPGQDFPSVTETWAADSPAPGLLAVGGMLDAQTLRRAYSQGIFPWYSQDQPPLWWSPDPRMVLQVANFRLYPSLKKTLYKFQTTAHAEIRMDSAFNQVIQACANSPRKGQAGTWIVPEMIAAYQALHRGGLAHSVEVWFDGELVGGLYCVALGRAVFGESMFSRVSDGSKIALAALVAFCRQHGIVQIDCQQNTNHLASLGAAEMPRQQFLQQVAQGQLQAAPVWHFQPHYWQHLSPKSEIPTHRACSDMP